MRRIRAGIVALLAGAVALAPLVYAATRLWPRHLHLSPDTPLPHIRVVDGTARVEMPDRVPAAQVGRYTDELSAYLEFEYVAGLPAVSGSPVLLACSEQPDGPVYRTLIVLRPDILTGTDLVARLRAGRLIRDFDLAYLTPSQLEEMKQQTRLFQAAYRQPVMKTLEELKPERVVPAMARFIEFKSRTDRRVREGVISNPLSLEQAHRLAADIIAVARFYSLPLDMFLGIGAMENNYLARIGDWEHATWKKRAQPGDVVLRRRRGRVLVWNYSVGVWQITRETLRHAHKLYLEDTRDYSRLPDRLRPPEVLDLAAVNDDVLTTYAGLLLRSLLDRFGGDVETAVAAYNGGVDNPNLRYAGGVRSIAAYARRVLEQAAALNGRTAFETPFMIAAGAPRP